MKRWLYISLYILVVCIFLASAFFLGRYMLASRAQQEQYDELAQIVENEQTAPTEPAPTVSEEEEAPLRILPEYANLHAENDHLIGWIHVPGTKINYPVMYTPDDPNFYLNHNFSREDSVYGCIYAQEDCDLFTPSDNVILYGHNMRNGSMFAALHKYKKESFYQEHKTFIFNTLYNRRNYEILSVFNTTVREDDGFAYYEFTQAATAAEFDAYVQNCKALSLYDTGVDAQYGDKLVTLSTCEFSQPNERLIIVAKLSKTGENS